MAEVAVKPFVLKDATVNIDVDDFAAAVSSAICTPTAAAVTFSGMKPGATFSDVAPATWVLALTFAQDWESTTSLSSYLHEHEGETVPMTFEPKTGGTGFTADVIITPGAIGGAVNTYGTATVNLGIQGKPTKVPAV